MCNLKFLASVLSKAIEIRLFLPAIVFGFFVVFYLSAENSTPQCHHTAQGDTWILEPLSRADAKQPFNIGTNYTSFSMLLLKRVKQMSGMRNRL